MLFKKIWKFLPLTLIQELEMFINVDLTQENYKVIRNTNKKFIPCCTFQNMHKKCDIPIMERKWQSLVGVPMKLLENILFTIEDKEKDGSSKVCKLVWDISQQPQFKKKIDTKSDSNENISQNCCVPD